MSKPPKIRLSPSIGVKHGPVYSKSSLSVLGILHTWADDLCSSQLSTLQLSKHKRDTDSLGLQFHKYCGFFQDSMLRERLWL